MFVTKAIFISLIVNCKSFPLLSLSLKVKKNTPHNVQNNDNKSVENNVAIKLKPSDLILSSSSSGQVGTKNNSKL